MFKVGESYRNVSNKDREMFVWAIAKKTKESIKLVVSWVDPKTKQRDVEKGFHPIIIKTANFRDWKQV